MRKSDADELDMKKKNKGKKKNWKAHSMENKPKNVGALITRIKRQFAETIRLPSWSASGGSENVKIPTRSPRLVNALQLLIECTKK